MIHDAPRIGWVAAEDWLAHTIYSNIYRVTISSSGLGTSFIQSASAHSAGPFDDAPLVCVDTRTDGRRTDWTDGLDGRTDGTDGRTDGLDGLDRRTDLTDGLADRS